MESDELDKTGDCNVPVLPEEGPSALNSTILDYYKKFGRKRDLEQFFSLSTVQGDIRDPSSLFWRRMKSQSDSDSGEKSRESSTELCRISIKCSLPDTEPSSLQEEVICPKEDEDDSGSPPIITEYVEEAPLDISIQSDNQSDDNQSQKSIDALLDTSLNKPFSPTSSITSQRKLEWDSLGDVGYGNESDRKNSASSLSTLERLALKQQYSNHDTNLDSNIGLPTAQSTPLDENDMKFKSKKGSKITKIYQRDVDLVEVNVPESSNINPKPSINVNLTKHISFNVEKDGGVTVENRTKDLTVIPENILIERQIAPQVKLDKEIQTSLKKSKDKSSSSVETQKTVHVPVLINLNTLRRKKRRKVTTTKKKLNIKKKSEINKENFPIEEKSAVQVSEAESFEYMPGHIYNQNQMNQEHSKPTQSAGNKSSLESSGVLTTDSSKESRHSFTKDLEKSISLLKNTLHKRYNDSSLKEKLLKEVVQRLIKSRYRDDESTTDFLSGLSFSSKKLGLKEDYTTTSTSDANNTAEECEPTRPKKSILRVDKFNANDIASTSQSAPNLPLASNSERPITTNLTKILTTSNTESDMSSKEKSSDTAFAKTSSEELYQKYLNALKREEAYKKHLRDKEMFLKQKLVCSESSHSFPTRLDSKSQNRIKDLMKDLIRNNYDDGSGDASKLEGGGGSSSIDIRYPAVRKQRSHSVFTLSSGHSEHQRKGNINKRCEAKSSPQTSPKAGSSKTVPTLVHSKYQSPHLKSVTDSSVQVNISKHSDKIKHCEDVDKLTVSKEKKIPCTEILPHFITDISGEIKYVCVCKDKSCKRLPDNFLIYKCCRLDNKGIQSQTHSAPTTSAVTQCVGTQIAAVETPRRKPCKSTPVPELKEIKRSSKGSQTQLHSVTQVQGDKEIWIHECVRCTQTDITINPKISEPSLSDLKTIDPECCSQLICVQYRQKSKSSIESEMTKSSSCQDDIFADMCRGTENTELVVTPRSSSSGNAKYLTEKEIQSDNVQEAFRLQDEKEGKYMIPIQGTNMTLMFSIGTNAPKTVVADQINYGVTTDPLVRQEHATSLIEECFKGVQYKNMQSLSNASPQEQCIINTNEPKMVEAVVADQMNYGVMTDPIVTQEHATSMTGECSKEVQYKNVQSLFNPIPQEQCITNTNAPKMFKTVVADLINYGVTTDPIVTQEHATSVTEECSKGVQYKNVQSLFNPIPQDQYIINTNAPKMFKTVVADLITYGVTTDPIVTQEHATSLTEECSKGVQYKNAQSFNTIPREQCVVNTLFSREEIECGQQKKQLLRANTQNDLLKVNFFPSKVETTTTETMTDVYHLGLRNNEYECPIVEDQLKMHDNVSSNTVEYCRDIEDVDGRKWELCTGTNYDRATYHGVIELKDYGPETFGFNSDITQLKSSLKSVKTQNHVVQSDRSVSDSIPQKSKFVDNRELTSEKFKCVCPESRPCSGLCDKNAGSRTVTHSDIGTSNMNNNTYFNKKDDTVSGSSNISKPKCVCSETADCGGTCKEHELCMKGKLSDIKEIVSKRDMSTSCVDDPPKNYRCVCPETSECNGDCDESAECMKKSVGGGNFVQETNTAGHYKVDTAMKAKCACPETSHCGGTCDGNAMCMKNATKTHQSCKVDQASDCKILPLPNHNNYTPIIANKNKCVCSETADCGRTCNESAECMKDVSNRKQSQSEMPVKKDNSTVYRLVPHKNKCVCPETSECGGKCDENAICMKNTAKQSCKVDQANDCKILPLQKKSMNTKCDPDMKNVDTKDNKEIGTKKDSTSSRVKCVCSETADCGRTCDENAECMKNNNSIHKQSKDKESEKDTSTNCRDNAPEKDKCVCPETSDCRGVCDDNAKCMKQNRNSPIKKLINQRNLLKKQKCVCPKTSKCGGNCDRNAACMKKVLNKISISSKCKGDDDDSTLDTDSGKSERSGENQTENKKSCGCPSTSECGGTCGSDAACAKATKSPTWNSSDSESNELTRNILQAALKKSSESSEVSSSKDLIIDMIQDITNRYSKREIQKTEKRKCFKDIMALLNYLLDTEESTDADIAKALESATTGATDSESKTSRSTRLKDSLKIFQKKNKSDNNKDSTRSTSYLNSPNNRSPNRTKISHCGSPSPVRNRNKASEQKHSKEDKTEPSCRKKIPEPEQDCCSRKKVQDEKPTKDLNENESDELSSCKNNCNKKKNCSCNKKKLVDKGVQFEPKKQCKISESSDVPISTDFPNTSTDSATYKVLNKIRKECEKYHQKRCKSHHAKRCECSSSTSISCEYCKRAHHCQCRTYRCKCYKKCFEKKKSVGYNLIIQTSDSVLSEETPFQYPMRPLKNVILKVPRNKKNCYGEKVPFKEMTFINRTNSPRGDGETRSRSCPNDGTVRGYLEQNRPDFIEQCATRQKCLKLISESSCEDPNATPRLNMIVVHGPNGPCGSCEYSRPVTLLCRDVDGGVQNEVSRFDFQNVYPKIPMELSRSNNRAAFRELLSMQLQQRLEPMPPLKALSQSDLRHLAREYGIDSKQQKTVHPKFLNEREMKKHSEKIYKTLPEVRRKKEEIKKESIKRTNLLLASIFKKNLQKKALRGDVDISNYSAVLKI